MSDRTERLIDELVAELEPVRRIPRLRAVGAATALCGGTVAAIAIAWLGLRHDVLALDLSPHYAAVIAGLALFATGGLLAAVAGCVPGRERVARVGRVLLASAFPVWGLAGALMWAGGVPTGAIDGAWLSLAVWCLGLATVVGVVPALLLVRFVFGAYAHRMGTVMAAGSAGMVAFGSLAVHLTCSADAITHVGVAHVGAPLVVGAALGLLAVQLRRS